MLLRRVCALALGTMLMLPMVAAGPPMTAALQDGATAGVAPILARLQRVSEIYLHRILRFACKETLLEEELQPRSGDLRQRREATFRYLLQTDPERPEVTEFRQVESRDGIPVRQTPAVVETFIPPPYLWATLFAARNATLFRFQVIGSERRGVTDTVVIAFEGQMAFDRGRAMGEWSGRMWVDRDRLQPVHLEAEPARQEPALALALDAYRRAFRIAGIALKAKPRAYTLSVDFLISRHGLAFPSLAMWRQQVLVVSGDRLTEQSLVRRFSDYRFFGIQADEIMEALRGSVAEDAVPQ